MAYRTHHAEARISPAVAIAEIARHGFTAYRDGGRILCAQGGGVIATCDRFGDVSGGDVLGWLGY